MPPHIKILLQFIELFTVLKYHSPPNAMSEDVKIQAVNLLLLNQYYSWC